VYVFQSWMSSCFIVVWLQGLKPLGHGFLTAGLKPRPSQDTALCDPSHCLGDREQIPRFARDDSQKTKTKIKKQKNRTQDS
jgi:hypothetical protein